MKRSHDEVVHDQFGPRAAAYVQSAVHAAGDDLDALEAIAQARAASRALDLGAGGGHVAYRLAPYAGTVVACDLSPAMIAAVAATARDRGLHNIETQLGAAEALPFPDASFDFLASRFSAHHWQDFDAGLRQARRVLCAGATAIFIDCVSPGPAPLDTHLQAVELLRDPSHIRDRTAAEWMASLAGAGFLVKATTARRLRMDYASWVERMQTPEPHRAAIRSLQLAAAREIQRHYEIEPDGSFTLDTLQIEANAAQR